MLLSGVTYEPFGPVSGWTWADGTAHTRSYNLRGELEAHSLGGDTRTLTHDDAGRITTLTDAGTDVRVSYDALHRITGATSHLGTTRPPSQAFTYDANGNRLTLTEGSVTEILTYSPDSNRLASVSGTPPVTVILDAAGNTLDDGRHSYTYDDRGRLVAVDGTVTYQINALGQRVAKAAAEARLFAYDPAGQLTGEYTTTGTPVTEVIFLGDIPVAALQGARVYQVHADHLNTPRRLVAGGTVRWSWEADVFGAGAAQDDPDGDGTAVTFHWRFPGQYYDAETGHHYNYFRTYDPRTGRYLESDPIGLVAGSNSYSYANGHPLGLADPYGLFPIALVYPPTWVAAGKALAFAGSAFGAAWATNEVINHYNKPPSDAKESEGAKAPGKPSTDEGFENPKQGESWVKNPNPGKGVGHGWKERNGNVWIPTGKGGRAHGGPHWDVQLPDGSHVNVPPGKHIDQCR